MKFLGIRRLNMTNTAIQMYFEISDQESTSKIDEALQPITTFDQKLYVLQQKYGADNPLVFNSLEGGLSFSCLWFKEYPEHLDTKNEFKVSKGKNNEGYEVRPRKSNKDFYAEFSKDLEDAYYNALMLVLFGDENTSHSITYTKKNESYFISSSKSIVLPNRELTATEYSSLIN